MREKRASNSISVSRSAQRLRSFRAPLPAQNDDSPLDFAEQVLHEQSSYWWRLAIYAGLGTALAGTVFATIFIASLTAPGPLPFALRVDISADSALGALSILATIIVALQIAVRAERRDDVSEAAKLIARQHSLGTIAFLCGLAAPAIGLASAFGVYQRSQEWAILHAAAAVLGGVLLAALAADAAGGANTRFHAEIAKVKREYETRDLRLALTSTSERSKRQRTFAGLLMLLPTATLTIVNFAILPRIFGLGAGFTVSVALLSLGILALGIPLAWYCVSLRLRQRWGYLVMIQLGLVVLLLFFAVFFWLQVESTFGMRDASAGVALGVIAAFVGGPILITVLASAQNGVLSDLVRMRFEQRLRLLTGEAKPAVPEHRWFITLKLTLLTLIAAIVPVLGLPLAYYALRQAVTEGDSSARIRVIVRIGYTSLATHLTILVVLFVQSAVVVAGGAATVP